MKDVTFLVDNSNILREALIGVKAVYDVLTRNCPQNHGLPLRNSPVTNKLKANKVEYHQVFHKELPKRRKWKKRTSTPIALPDKLEGRRKMTSEQTEEVIVDLTLTSEDSNQDKETENTISEESKQATDTTRNNTFDGPQRIWKCDPVTRLLNAKGVNLGIHHVRGGSRGGVEGVATPPLSSFFLLLLFCLILPKNNRIKLFLRSYFTFTIRLLVNL